MLNGFKEANLKLLLSVWKYLNDPKFSDKQASEQTV